MPTSGYVDTLDPTTIGDTRVRFLLDLTIAGRTFHVSDGYFDVEDEDGTPLAYVDGLDDVDWERRMALFADSPGEVSVPFTLLLPDVDWAELRAAGHDLAAGTAELSRWVEGTTYGQRQRLVQGIVSEPTYGALGEPLAFSLDTVPLEDSATWPPTEDITIDARGFETAPDESLGLGVPHVFGTPGWVNAQDGGRITGTPAVLATNNAHWLIAGHRVRATQVWYIDKSDPASTWQTKAVSHGTSNRGTQYAFLDFETEIASSPNVDMWISWSPCAGGTITTPPRSSLNDNETFTIDDGTTSVTFELEVTGGFVATPGLVTVDLTGGVPAESVAGKIIEAINAQEFGIKAALGPILDVGGDLFATIVLANTNPGTAGNVAITEAVASGGFTVTGMEGGIDVYGGMEDPVHGGLLERAGDVLGFFLSLTSFGADRGRLAAARALLNDYTLAGYVDEQITPWEYVRAHIVPLLPISVVGGADGLYPVVWRYVVNELADAVERFDVQALDAERVGPVEVDKPTNVANAITLKWALSGAQDHHTRSTSVGGSDDTSAQNRVSRVSRSRYRRAKVKIEETDLVYSAATAARIVGWMAYAFGLPSESVAYSVEQARVLHLDLGNVVSLTDSDLHREGDLWHVVGLRDTDGGFVEVTLRSIEDPGRR